MTTKDYCLPFNDKRNTFNVDTFNGKYNNLNLNQRNQNSSNAFIKSSKSFVIEKKKVLNYDYLKTDGAISNIQLWNKSSTFISTDSEKEDDEYKKYIKNSSSSSTLSLHISTYKNLNEASASDPFDGTKECLKQYNSIKKNAKQSFIDSISVIQNSFEFPRQQQESYEIKKPEVSQFKASQHLLNPNQIN
uniref:Uncharacterized protein n=1 Tax=Panagrolaimus sp. PS1159 TaxID=55785 RepID=A0AC35GYK4_9BILA